MAAKENETLRGRTRDTLTALSIAILIALMLLMVMHHPVGRHTDPAELVTSITRQASLDRWVHGMLAAAMTVMTSIMVGFAMRLGLNRPHVLLGTVCSGLALVLICQSVLLDGFVAPALASSCVMMSAQCVREAQALLGFGALQIEFMTRLALFGLASTTALWAADLMFRRERAGLAGAFGLLSAAVQFGILMAGGERLNPHNLALFVSAQAVWYLSVASVIVFRKGPFAAR